MSETMHAGADALSRRHQIVAGPPGLWILTGGKLTTHRRMAEDLVDEIAPFLAGAGVEVEECRTREGRFSTGSLESGEHRLAASGSSSSRTSIRVESSSRRGP